MKLPLLIFSSLLVQTLFSQEFHGGPVLGIVASQVDGDHFEGYNKTGPIIGGFVTYPLKEKWDLLLEIHYIQKGSLNKTNPDIPEKMYYKLRLNYFEVPVLAKYQYREKIYFTGGINLGFLFKAFEEGIDQTGALVKSEEESFHKMDYCLNAGIQYQLVDKMYASASFNYSVFMIRGQNGNGLIDMRTGQYNNFLIFCLYYKL